MINVKIDTSGLDRLKRKIEDTEPECARIAVRMLNEKNLYCEECKEKLTFRVEGRSTVAGGCIHYKDLITQIMGEAANEFFKTL